MAQHHSLKDISPINPDVAQAFPTDESVNDALRLLLQIAQRHQGNR